MNFTTLPLWAVLSGLGGLAAALFGLQMLRTRYRPITVASTLFWRRAVQETPVRKLWQRFRHPLAYLLILAICSLIWLAIAEPRITSEHDEAFHVLVLDGSAAMAVDDRFDTAVSDLKRHIDSLPADRRQVVWAGADLRTLLNAGEDSALLGERLRGLAPEATRARLEQALTEIVAARPGSPAAVFDVTLFGAAPVRASVLASLPESVSVKRARQYASVGRNAGITALGVSDGHSWDKVDVLVRAEDKSGALIEASGLHIDLDGKAVPASMMQVAANSAGILVKDLPAGGGLLTVRLLAQDALSLDDTAALRLPEKRPLKVLLSPSLPASLRVALQSDPAVQITDAGATLVIRRRGERIGLALPALEFVSAAEQPAAFVFTHPGARDDEDSLVDAVDRTGLRHIDAMALAQVAQRPVSVTWQSGRQWRLSVWQELLTDEFNFTRSPAFPLFIAQAVRWLGGVVEAPSWVAAGRPLPQEPGQPAPRIVDTRQRAVTLPGVMFVPQRAGELLRSASSDLSIDARARSPLVASLLDPVTTLDVADSTVPLYSPDSAARVASSWGLPALIALALLLLAAEWFLHGRGRVP